MGFTRIGMSCAASGPHQRPILDVMQSTVRLRSLLKYEKQVKAVNVTANRVFINYKC